MRRPVILLLILVTLVAAAIWAVTLWEISSGRAKALEAENLKNANLAKAQEERVLRSLQVLDQALLVLRDDFRNPQLRESLEQRIETMQLDRNYVGVVSLINEKGDVARTNAKGMVINFAEREYFKYHASHDTDILLVGPPILGKFTGKWLVSLTRRIFKPDGSFGGVIFMAVNPEYLVTGYGISPGGPHASTALVGLDGISRVRHNSGTTTYGDDFRKSRLLDEARKSPQGQYVGASITDGEERTVSYRLVAGHPLVISVASSTADVLAMRREAENIYIGLALLSTALVVSLGVSMNGAWLRIEDALQRVRASEKKFRSIIDVSPVPMATNDDRFNITYLNPAFINTYGYTLEDIPTLDHWWPLAYPDADYRQKMQRQWADELGRSAMTGTRFEPLEAMIQCKDGSRKYAVAGAAELADSFIGEHLVVLYDITSQKVAQTELSAMVLEKNALLKEVHHRVKNNLQVITSLLRLEISRAGHPSVREVLDDMKWRIRSMALLHESLYRSGTFASVRLDSYIKQLSTEVFRSVMDHQGKVSLVLDLAPVTVSMNQATPFGLIINELMSNALKHGFADGRRGTLTIELLSSENPGHAILRVSDDGMGLPLDFDARKADSLGMQLVSDLALQIGSSLRIGPAPLAAFTLEFTPEGAAA